MLRNKLKSVNSNPIYGIDDCPSSFSVFLGPLSSSKLFLSGIDFSTLSHESFPSESEKAIFDRAIFFYSRKKQVRLMRIFPRLSLSTTLFVASAVSHSTPPFIHLTSKWAPNDYFWFSAWFPLECGINLTWKRNESVGHEIPIE